jgi:broad specificity phosphatase PhoE
LHLPSHDALVFGDALVTTPDGELRIWHNEPVDERRVAFYAERFAPTLEPLIALEPQRILVTHGAPILSDGAAALRRAAAAPPWYHRG